MPGKFTLKFFNTTLYIHLYILYSISNYDILTLSNKEINMDFKSININDDIVRVLNKKGIKTPNEVQNESIPILLSGKDAIIKAQTGSGKTLAYLLPIFQKLKQTDKIQVLILAPTRELALQIFEQTEELSVANNLRSLAIYGGKDINKQLKKLGRGADIIVATPGRLLDHMSRGSIDISSVNQVIIDEADQMLLMGFKKEIDEIIPKTSNKRQTVFLSATINSEVKKIAYRYSKNPLFVDIKTKHITLDEIDQSYVFTTDRKKQSELFRILKEDNPFMAIIFCRTKARVDKLEENMSGEKFDCAKLHSDISQSKREKTLKKFRKGDLQYLIATDVASRGLDISGVDYVYNYDIPENAKDYIHRIGRTGRAKHKGTTCMFYTEKDSSIFEEIQKTVGEQLKLR